MGGECLQHASYESRCRSGLVLPYGKVAHIDSVGAVVVGFKSYGAVVRLANNGDRISVYGCREDFTVLVIRVVAADLGPAGSRVDLYAAVSSEVLLENFDRSFVTRGLLGRPCGIDVNVIEIDNGKVCLYAHEASLLVIN